MDRDARDVSQPPHDLPSFFPMYGQPIVIAGFGVPCVPLKLLFRRPLPSHHQSTRLPVSEGKKDLEQPALAVPGGTSSLLPRDQCWLPATACFSGISPLTFPVLLC